MLCMAWLCRSALIHLCCLCSPIAQCNVIKTCNTFSCTSIQMCRVQEGKAKESAQERSKAEEETRRQDNASRKQFLRTRLEELRKMRKACVVKGAVKIEKVMERRKSLEDSEEQVILWGAGPEEERRSDTRKQILSRLVGRRKLAQARKSEKVMEGGERQEEQVIHLEAEPGRFQTMEVKSLTGSEQTEDIYRSTLPVTSTLMRSCRRRSRRASSISAKAESEPKGVGLTQGRVSLRWGRGAEEHGTLATTSCATSTPELSLDGRPFKRQIPSQFQVKSLKLKARGPGSGEALSLIDEIQSSTIIKQLPTTTSAINTVFAQEKVTLDKEVRDQPGLSLDSKPTSRPAHAASPCPSYIKDGDKSESERRMEIQPVHLESLFSSVDTEHHSLDSLQEQMKHFRRSSMEPVDSSLCASNDKDPQPSRAASGPPPPPQLARPLTSTLGAMPDLDAGRYLPKDQSRVDSLVSSDSSSHASIDNGPQPSSALSGPPPPPPLQTRPRGIMARGGYVLKGSPRSSVQRAEELKLPSALSMGVPQDASLYEDNSILSSLVLEQQGTEDSSSYFSFEPPERDFQTTFDSAQSKSLSRFDEYEMMGEADLWSNWDAEKDGVSTHFDIASLYGSGEMTFSQLFGEAKTVTTPKLNKSELSGIFTSQKSDGSWGLDDLQLVKLKGHLVEAILVKAGAKSLGFKAFLALKNLVSTLLVLKILSDSFPAMFVIETQPKIRIVRVNNEFSSGVKMAVSFVESTDKTYPSLCSRLELGYNWDFAIEYIIKDSVC